MRDLPVILNILGLSLDFVGGFLLTVEALRIARVLKAADALKSIVDLMTSSAGFHQPLPLQWPFALACLLFSVVVLLFAPFLIIFTLTPILFVAIFLLYRFIQWSVKISQDGYIAVVGFALFAIGAALQIASAVYSL